MSRNVIILLFFVTALFSACTSIATETPADEVNERQSPIPEETYTDITIAELQTMLANKDFIFVNVHIPFEGNISGTDLSIPYDEIEKNLDLLPADKDARIVLYCRSGRMSSIAGEKLASLGYSNVFNLEGGMIAWEQAGLSLER